MTGNERFFQHVLAAEASAQEAHDTLFSNNSGAFNRFFAVSSKFGEPYARENFPDLADAVDRIYLSLGRLHEMRSSTARRDALVKSLVAEMEDIAANGEKSADPVVRLRTDLIKLSTFRVERLDGVILDFWLANAQRLVSLLDKKGLSAPATVAWCKVLDINPKTLSDALVIIAPLWDKHSLEPLEIISRVAANLDNYPFDPDVLLENAKAWPEANVDLITGVIAAREVRNAIPGP